MSDSATPKPPPSPEHAGASKQRTPNRGTAPDPTPQPEQIATEDSPNAAEDRPVREAEGTNASRKAARNLSRGARFAVLGCGGILMLVGIAGLALPGIQGVLTMAFAAALLSLGSPPVYRILKRLLKRWPKVWKLVEGFRSRILERFGS